MVTTRANTTAIATGTATTTTIAFATMVIQETFAKQVCQSTTTNFRFVIGSVIHAFHTYMLFSIKLKKG